MADTKMVKSTGEHWVCSMMSRLGWGVALTRDGLERTDILAVDPNAAPRRLIEVQVKTASGNGENTNWPLGLKSQTRALSDAEWFVFVILNDAPANTRCFVVPRDHVAAATWISHTSWLTDPDAVPGKRNTPIKNARVYRWVFEGYEDRWDLLEAPADKAPVLLPAEFREYALDARVGLPHDHPWNDRLPDW
ncbi:hypothetical protein [Nocardioides ochotonae]|uniref:hypothetical protein n=1 Tax=Nocardioides ochotonae TaxID=2685869 RepID=UPI001CD533B8|nr:hypothetical protein [Nocardioides ochotonae]